MTDRKFDISPKTPYEDIAKFAVVANSDTKAKAARDLVQDAKELAPDLPWVDILNSIVHSKLRDHPLTGEKAVAEIAGGPTISYAKAARVGFSHQDIVLLSGYFFVAEINNQLKAAVSCLEGFGNGTTTSTRTQSIGEYEEAIERLRPQSQYLTETNSKYQNFASINDETALILFAVLPLKVENGLIGTSRSTMITSLKNGKFESALKYAQIVSNFKKARV